MCFYELGVHDNGELVGIDFEEMFETLIHLFHIASNLSAILAIDEIRFGTVGYNAKVKVTQPNYKP